MVGYAGATLCATVLHVLRTNRLGVDIPFTHSPIPFPTHNSTEILRSNASLGVARGVQHHGLMRHSNKHGRWVGFAQRTVNIFEL